ncbi:MAG: ABC transporter substrate-binding protein [Xanthobacteraceae bacterium]|jgi:NitT/TauT family transport system substrate-binding protein
MRRAALLTGRIRGIGRAISLAFILAAALAAFSQPAFAQTKVIVGLTQFNEVAPVMIAKEEGFFAKHGFDVTIQLIPLNSTMPAALQSDSIQIAGLTPPVLLQAVDGGLDLVAVAGGAVGSNTDTNFGVVARPEAGIKNAADFIGKKVGVPGIGATLQVMFRKWLTVKGVDYNKVTFIETPFPQMPDMLKGGSVDAVVSANPFMGRIIEGKIGTLVTNMAPDMPAGMASFFYSSTRDWATKHPDAAKAFRQAVAEGVAFAGSNLDGARADFGKYVKLPQPVLATIVFTGLNAEPTVPSLAVWIDTMNEQKMLKSKVAAQNLIFP